MMVPMVAASSPRINVFLIASVVADSSKNTNLMFCRVKLLTVTTCEATFEKVALSSAK